ncbi:MAG: NDP-sugar synthase [Myxococcales bacterium]|nr:NDP-sugar synthase [Myxococcales bacterium]
MRGMIVAAGLGTRLLPLTHWRPKPAVPVRGVPLIAYSLAFLAEHGVDEISVNVHHLPDELEAAAREWCPAGVRLQFSREDELLGTGGGIRKVAAFLRESDPCVILGGDMLLDCDLDALLRVHRERHDAVTLLLREDPRAGEFGTIGVDDDGCVRRIASRFDLGGSTRAGVYAWVNVVAPRAFDSLPDVAQFSHLDAWWAPLLRAGARDIRAELMAPGAGFWEPVGTLEEYLDTNLRPLSLSYLDVPAATERAGARIETTAAGTADVVLGAGAHLGTDVALHRAVVWDGESVPAGFQGKDGIWAGGAWHAVAARSRPPEEGAE